MDIQSVIQNVGAYTSEAILIADADLMDGAVMSVRWCNPAFFAMTGYEPCDVIGRTGSILVGQATDADARQSTIESLMRWESFVVEWETNRKDGSQFSAEMSWRPIQDEDGIYRFWICVVRDVTLRKSTAAALDSAIHSAQQARKRMVEAIEILGQAFAIYDSNDRLVLCNNRYREAFKNQIRIGMTYQEVIGLGISHQIYDLELNSANALIDQLLIANNDGSEGVIVCFANGKIFNVVKHRTSVGDLVVLGIDITSERAGREQLEAYSLELENAKRLAEKRARDLEAARARIEHNSLHDELTGLPNRNYLSRIVQETAVRMRSREQRFAAMHLNVDRFRDINDVFGHDAGDTVLMHISETLQDYVEPGDFVARLGSDEFVVVTSAVQSSAEVVERAEALAKAAARPVIAQGRKVSCVVSIGIAMSDLTEEDPNALIIAADLALSRAKKSERSWAFYSAELRTELIEAKELSDDIRRGLAAGEFIAHYQPQFSAETHEIIGAEALIRWRHPKKGLLAPARFLKQAQEIDVVKLMDRLILFCVAEDIRVWQSEGIEVPHISINVSGGRLRDPSLIDDVKISGIDPRRLSMEVLESAFMDDHENSVAWNIDGLKELGVAIELDDFGTGHSSLISLVKLEPTRLKIDRAFVGPIIDQPDKRALVKAIVEIAQTLGVGIVAEGVETAEHAELLRVLGCQCLQGAMMSMPVAPEVMADMLSGNWPYSDTAHAQQQAV